MAEKMEAKRDMGAAIASKPALGVRAPGKPAKPQSRVSGGAIAALLLIVLLIVATAVVFFNVGGVRQQLADALQTEQARAEGEATAMGAAQIEQRQSELDAQAARLDEQKAVLKERTDKLKEREQAAADRERALAEQEEALTAREQAVNDAETDIREAQQAQDELAATAKIFEAMEPAVAATAISGLSSVDDMVKLLKQIPSSKAAAILGNMEVKLATRVLSEMIK